MVEKKQSQSQTVSQSLITCCFSHRTGPLEHQTKLRDLQHGKVCNWKPVETEKHCFVASGGRIWYLHPTSRWNGSPPVRFNCVLTPEMKQGSAGMAFGRNYWTVWLLSSSNLWLIRCVHLLALGEKTVVAAKSLGDESERAWDCNQILQQFGFGEGRGEGKSNMEEAWHILINQSGRQPIGMNIMNAWMTTESVFFKRMVTPNFVLR